MAKKSRLAKTFDKFENFILLGIAVVALLMAFLPFVTSINGAKDGEPTLYSGFEVAFGKELGSVDAIVGGGSVKLIFNIFTVLALFLPIAGVIVNIILHEGKLGTFIKVGCFAVAAVFLFMTLVFAKEESTITLLGKESSGIKSFADLNADAVKIADKEVWGLGVGAIIAAILNIIGDLLSLVKLLKK